MWKSIYIYCHDVWVQEKLLLELRPLLDETKKRWFFIKYWYGGPHIRLRFEEQSEEFFKKIDTTVSRFFQKNRVEDLQPEQFYSFVTFREEHEGEKELPWYGSGTILEEEYVPETERYGTGEVLAASEEMFCRSSKLAMHLFLIAKKQNTRIIFSMYFLYQILRKTGVNMEEFLQRYEAYWKTGHDGKMHLSTESMKHVMEKIRGEEIDFHIFDSEMEELVEGALEIKKLVSEEAFSYILSSQVHMMNNRISVTTDFEYEIAKIMREVLYG